MAKVPLQLLLVLKSKGQTIREAYSVIIKCQILALRSFAVMDKILKKI